MLIVLICFYGDWFLNSLQSVQYMHNFGCNKVVFISCERTKMKFLIKVQVTKECTSFLKVIVSDGGFLLFKRLLRTLSITISKTKFPDVSESRYDPVLR
jgi:hypothetical protein